LKLDRQTVDRVTPGQASSEREHAFAGEKCEAGDFGGRAYREAYDGGWCSYRLKVAPGEDQALYVQYWGSDAGARTFDLLVDGRILATQKLNREKPNRFYSVLYPLNKAWLIDQSAITVRFQARAKNLAGGFYDLRILRVRSENGF
ncbi:MAG TPA: glycoside hydrolase family 127 protein, partial [bacterium]|nr:glycoside hydrolase family 127 protein [bacterium]